MFPKLFTLFHFFHQPALYTLRNNSPLPERRARNFRPLQPLKME